MQRAGGELIDHRGPRGLELPRRSRGSAPGDAVRLLDERDAEPLRDRDFRGGDEVGSGHPATGSMAENERASRLHRGLQMCVRRPVRGFEDYDAEGL